MKTIDKALDLILEISRRPLNIAEAAEFLDIHYSSASRMLKTMRNKGFLAITKDHRHIIGPAFFLLSAGGNASEDLIGAAHPIMQRLNEQVSETIHLGVLSDLQIIFVDKIDSTHMIRMHSYIGLSLPLHETAIGKLILAFQPLQTRQDMVREITSHPHTIKDIDLFLAEVATIAEEGIANNWGLHDKHINSIAAPIFGSDRKIKAGISISVPVIYTNKDKLLSYRPLLLNAAHDISAQLGYQGQEYNRFQEMNKFS